MATRLTRYYDRYAFIGREGGGSGFGSYMGERYGVRRGKLTYQVRSDDRQEFAHGPPTAHVNTFGVRQKNPVIVIPVTKTKPMISSY
jgi:hypothetical protein